MVLLVPVLVFATFLVICTLMTVGEPLNPTRPLVSFDQSRAYAHRLQKLIACQTVSQEGEFAQLPFQQLREQMQELFPNVHRHARSQIAGDGCWVYILPGKNTDRNILLLAHHDVASAEGKWKYPPFSGEIADGKLWGRGTVNNKTNLFAIFSAMEELLSEGFCPECNVWVVSSHNTQAGGDGAALAADFFRQQGITFDFVLDQGEAVADPPISAMNCSKCAMIAFQEKGTHQMILTADAGTNHAGALRATPTERMADFISEIRREGIFIRRMTPELETMLKAMAPYTAFSLKLELANLWLFKGLLVKQLPNISREAAELLGTTCSFNNLVTRADGRRCTARIVLRSMDAGDLKTDLTRMRTLATKYGIRVESAGENAVPKASNPQSPALAKVTRCIHEIFPDVPVIPFVLPEATDARFFADLSDCVLRFSPLRLTAQQIMGARGADENVDIVSIGTAVIFYRRILESYTSGQLREDLDDEDLDDDQWEEDQEPVTASEEIPEEENIHLTDDFSAQMPEDYESHQLLEEPLLEDIWNVHADELTDPVLEEVPQFSMKEVSADLLGEYPEDMLEDISDFDISTLTNWEEYI